MFATIVVIYYLPVVILANAFLRHIINSFLVGPMTSKQNPIREKSIDKKHRMIIICIRSTTSGVTQGNAETKIFNISRTPLSEHY